MRSTLTPATSAAPQCAQWAPQVSYTQVAGVWVNQPQQAHLPDANPCQGKELSPSSAERQGQGQRWDTGTSKAGQGNCKGGQQGYGNGDQKVQGKGDQKDHGKGDQEGHARQDTGKGHAKGQAAGSDQGSSPGKGLSPSPQEAGQGKASGKGKGKGDGKAPEGKGGEKGKDSK